MEHPWQENWNGLSFPSPGDLSNPEIEPMSSALAGGLFTTEPPGNLKLKKYLLIDCYLEGFQSTVVYQWLTLKSESEVTQLCPTFYNPVDCIAHGILQAKILEWVAFPFSRGLPNSWIELRSPTLQVDSLPAESQHKPENTGVGRLSLLRWIFQTQESSQGLLHCRWIPYQLSYQASQLEEIKIIQGPKGQLYPSLSNFVFIS